MLSRKSTSLSEQVAPRAKDEEPASAPSFNEIRAEIARLQSRPVESLFQPLWVSALIRVFSLLGR